MTHLKKLGLSASAPSVALRYAVLKTSMEHASPEALKKYLKDHPNADKSKHTVGKGKGKSKEDHTLKSDAGTLVKEVDVAGLLADYAKETVKFVKTFLHEQGAEGIERLLSTLASEVEQNVDNETRNALNEVLDGLLSAGGFWHEPDEDEKFGKRASR
jgi:hypothetical protein